MRVSVAESIDAFRALDVVGYGDRAILKDTLGLVLAKTHDEKQLFDECFNLYFERSDFAERHGDEEPRAAAPADMAEPPLAQMLVGGDRAGLAASMELAAEAVGLS